MMDDPRFDDVIREASSFATPADAIAWLREATPPEHVSTYVSGCRCAPCRAGWSAYRKRRRERAKDSAP